jgi:ABC-type branched-subunit amino acid transport system substrate-binding protein
MLTLTASAESLAAGDRVFHTFPSTEAQIEALLDEAHGKRGLPRYAVLHPKTAYGENAARAFADALARRGATLVHSVAYDPKTADFRSVVKAIAPTGGGSVGYDALFIPDAYQRVALIASALAYQEVAVGRFRPHSSDTPVTLLGLNAWNNEELAARGGQYVLDSIFVDAFDVRAADPLTLSFVEAWTARSQGPPTVVEAVGYDTMLLVTAALERQGDATSAVRDATLPQSLTGIERFDAGRDVVRRWRLLTVTREGIAPLDPPAPTEPPP